MGHPKSNGWPTLVELVGDDGVLDEELEGDDLEGVLVGGFEDDGAGGSGLLYLEPARGADAPAIAGFEAGKPYCGMGVERSLPRALEASRKGRLTTQQMVWTPRSSGPVSQQPVR